MANFENIELYELEVFFYWLFKCFEVEIFREATQSSHEGHYVGRTVVQLSRVMGVVRIRLRDTASQLPLSRQRVNFHYDIAHLR